MPASNDREPSPFNLENDDAYRRWREARLDCQPTRIEDLVVDVAAPGALQAHEVQALTRCCRVANLAVYRAPADSAVGRAEVAGIGAALGLQSLDYTLHAHESGINLLQVEKEGRRPDYVPYTDRPLNWHTDGYYNEAGNPVRAFILHCAASAGSGGENSLLDPEIAYIRLRDEDPALVRALMADDALTIPANELEGGNARAASTGPVFSVDPLDGNLLMRYTARKRHIHWKEDRATRAAVAFLENVLISERDYLFTLRLEPGEGLICNNALHNRTGFQDDPDAGQGRRMYRARYHDRVNNTNFWRDFDAPSQ